MKSVANSLRPLSKPLRFVVPALAGPVSGFQVQHRDMPDRFWPVCFLSRAWQAICSKEGCMGLRMAWHAVEVEGC